MARFWGGEAKQATTQTVASAAPRLGDTSGRREIAPLKTLGVASSTPTYSASLDVKVKLMFKHPNHKHKKGETKPTFLII